MVEAGVDALPDTEDAVAADPVAVTIAKLCEDVAVDAETKDGVWMDAGALDGAPVFTPANPPWEGVVMMVW
jgi:hypothetical protein